MTPFVQAGDLVLDCHWYDFTVFMVLTEEEWAGGEMVKLSTAQECVTGMDFALTTAEPQVFLLHFYDQAAFFSTGVDFDHFACAWEEF